MYSTDVEELTHKVPIKEGYWHSNKNNASHQILHYYGRVHAVSMRLITLRSPKLEKQKAPVDWLTMRTVLFGTK